MQHHNFVKAGIQKLSQPQIKKLLSGGNVRVKHGSYHQVPMTHEQHHKLMDAHKRGAGTTLTAHSNKHAEMLGGSLLGDKIKNGFKSIGKVLGKTIVHNGADFLKKQPLLSPISGLINQGEKFINHKIDGLGLRRRRVVIHKSKGLLSHRRKHCGGALLAAGYGFHKKRHTLKKKGCGVAGRSSRRRSVKHGRGVEGDEEDEEEEEEEEYSDNDYSEDSESDEDDYEPSSYKPSKKGGYIM